MSPTTQQKDPGGLLPGDVVVVGWSDRRTVAAEPEWDRGMYRVTFTDGTTLAWNGYCTVTVEAPTVEA